MKKNPLVLLLALSGVFFVVFLAFVYFVFNSFGNGDGFVTMGRGNVGVVPINGAIMGSKKTLKQIKRYSEDDAIKAIILRINSPGGAVAPSQEIHDAIRQLNAEKPVIASIESLGASGAYYIAVAASEIIANPGSITGSIGVIMEFANLSGVYKFLKVRRYSLKSAKYKDAGTDTRELTSEERARLQGMIDNVHQQFVTAVAQGRKLERKKVDAFANGGIYTGEQAQKLKMVDRLGGLQVAIDRAKELASLPGEVKLVYPAKKKPGLAEILNSNLSSLLEQTLGFSLPAKNLSTALVSGPMYLWKAGL